MDNEKRLVITQPFCDYENVLIFNLTRDDEGVGLYETIAEAGSVYKDDCYVLFGKRHWQKDSDNYFLDYFQGVAKTRKDADEKLRTILHNFAIEYVGYIREKYESSLKEAEVFEGWQNVTLEDLTLDISNRKLRKAFIK